MVTTKQVAATTVDSSSENTFAAAVLAYIGASESALQLSLEDMYVNMKEETIRSLRRTMPVTRSKMDWNLNSVRIIRQVRK